MNGPRWNVDLCPRFPPPATTRPVPPFRTNHLSLWASHPSSVKWGKSFLPDVKIKYNNTLESKYKNYQIVHSQTILIELMELCIILILSICFYSINLCPGQEHFFYFSFSFCESNTTFACYRQSYIYSFRKHCPTVSLWILHICILHLMRCFSKKSNVLTCDTGFKVTFFSHCRIMLCLQLYNGRNTSILFRKCNNLDIFSPLRSWGRNDI